MKRRRACISETGGVYFFELDPGSRPVGQTIRKRLVEQAGDKHSKCCAFDSALGVLDVVAVPFEMKDRQGYGTHSLDRGGTHCDHLNEHRPQLKRLGHTKPDITLRVYAHLFRNDDGKAAAINAALAR
jgi:hypothetical protein